MARDILLLVVSSIVILCLSSLLVAGCGIPSGWYESGHVTHASGQYGSRYVTPTSGRYESGHVTHASGQYGSRYVTPASGRYESGHVTHASGQYGFGHVTPASGRYKTCLVVYHTDNSFVTIVFLWYIPHSDRRGVPGNEAN